MHGAMLQAKLNRDQDYQANLIWLKHAPAKALFQRAHIGGSSPETPAPAAGANLRTVMSSILRCRNGHMASSVMGMLLS
jgi:hypothetical protein